jgi:hypothetical protein
MAPPELIDLRSEVAPITGYPMNEDERRIAAACLLIRERHTLPRKPGHSAPPVGKTPSFTVAYAYRPGQASSQTSTGGGRAALTAVEGSPAWISEHRAGPPGSCHPAAARCSGEGEAPGCRDAVPTRDGRGSQLTPRGSS